MQPLCAYLCDKWDGWQERQRTKEESSNEVN
jgi:hypothetical protein